MSDYNKQQFKQNLTKLATMNVSKRDKVAWWAAGIAIVVLALGYFLRQV